MLDTDRTLVLAGTAGRALKYRRLRNRRTDDRRVARSSVLIQIGPQTQRNLLRVQLFPRVVGWTMFGASAAFNARMHLKRRQFREVFPRIEPQVFITGKRRNLAEAAS